ncbi:hypothetical protein CDD80_3613 [Ophiocordyceps camponoti-rufipedis]|uniref:Uncharacterized protein n=1 Tax=Ophiocordyceps camponoti-rufipedis TaxID=2004952 RepID=A0A2C5YW02_9HYPO|nr:hypothetical protein CDD80_3613 [Ophiocordyceps camponoti-rufipedis]
MYRLSIAASALLAMHGVLAQQSPVTDQYPAEHTEEFKGYEGQYVDACSPVGTIRYNSTFPPCLSSSRIESSCALPWKEGVSDEQRQGDWQAERKCLCEGSFFDDAGDGCLKCKEAYHIDSKDNLGIWKGFWEKMRGSYCKEEKLAGNFSTYWSGAFAEVSGSFKYGDDLGAKPAPGSIPIESYYTNDKQGPGPLPGSAPAGPSNNSSVPSNSTEETGVAQLTPDCRTMTGAIDTLPAGNSAKFSNSSSGAILVSVTVNYNRICIINRSNREIQAVPQSEPEVKPISDKVIPKKEAAKEADFDMTGCPCAQQAVPEDKEVVKSESSLNAWNKVSVICGFDQEGGKASQGCEGPECGGATKDGEESSSDSGDVYGSDVMGTFGESEGSDSAEKTSKNTIFVVKITQESSDGEKEGTYGQPKCTTCGKPKTPEGPSTSETEGSHDQPKCPICGGKPVVPEGPSTGETENAYGQEQPETSDESQPGQTYGQSEAPSSEQPPAPGSEKPKCEACQNAKGPYGSEPEGASSEPKVPVPEEPTPDGTYGPTDGPSSEQPQAQCPGGASCGEADGTYGQPQCTDGSCEKPEIPSDSQKAPEQAEDEDEEDVNYC